MSEEIKSFIQAFEKPLSELFKAPVVTVEASITIAQGVKIMQEKKIGSIIVVRDKKLVGIVTERDILMKVVGKVADLNKYKITQVMTAGPVTLQSEDKVAFVMNNMYIGGYRHVPVVNANNEPVSVISIKDVMNFIFSNFPADVIECVDEPSAKAKRTA